MNNEVRIFEYESVQFPIQLQEEVSEVRVFQLEETLHETSTEYLPVYIEEKRFSRLRKSLRKRSAGIF